MDIITSNRVAIRVICLRRVGPYSGINAAFTDLETSLADHGVSTEGKEYYGLYYHDLENKEAPEADLVSDICITIPEEDDLKQLGYPVGLPEGYRIYTIPEGKYAMGTFSGGQPSTIPNWNEMHTWLGGANPHADSEYVIEAYGASPPLQSGKTSGILLLVKVAPQEG